MKLLLYRDTDTVLKGYDRKAMSDTLYEQITFYGLLIILYLN